MTTEKDLKDVPEVPVTLPPPRFANPWQGLKGDPTASTVNCIMPKEAFTRVKQCRLEGGTIQTTMNHLWLKLITLLEQKGIYGYESVREFEDAVQRSVLIMPEDLARLAGGGTSPVPGSTTEATNAPVSLSDDSRATEQLRNAAQSEPQQSNLPSNVSEGSTKRSEGKLKRGKGKSQQKS